MSPTTTTTAAAAATTTTTTIAKIAAATVPKDALEGEGLMIRYHHDQLPEPGLQACVRREA